MIGGLYGGSGSSPGHVSSTAKWKEFLSVASGNVTTGISRAVCSITENAPDYYNYVGGGDISASVSSVLGYMAANISPSAGGIREYALRVREEAKPQVSGTLRALRDKVRERVPFEVRSHIPGVVRESADRLIRMSEKSGRERYEEKINNATVAMNNPPTSSYDTTATKYRATPIELGSCEDYVLCKDLFGEEKSQNTLVSRSAHENPGNDITLNTSHEKSADDSLAGIYSYYHVKDFVNKDGEGHGNGETDFLSIYSYYYKKDIAKEDRERREHISSTASTPSTHVANIHLTSHTVVGKGTGRDS